MPELWKVHFSRKCSLFGEKRVENSDTAKEMNTYIGASENEWKKRYYNHKLNFNENSTTLTMYYCKIKWEVGKSPKTTWRIYKQKVLHIKNQGYSGRLCL